MNTKKEQEYLSSVANSFTTEERCEFNRLMAMLPPTRPVGPPMAPPVNAADYQTPAAYGYGYFSWGFPYRWTPQSFEPLAQLMRKYSYHILFFAGALVFGVVFHMQQ